MFVSVGDESAGVDVLYCSQEGVGEERKKKRKESCLTTGAAHN
jgi:hypothetical protein